MTGLSRRWDPRRWSIALAAVAVVAVLAAGLEFWLLWDGPRWLPQGSDARGCCFVVGAVACLVGAFIGRHPGWFVACAALASVLVHYSFVEVVAGRNEYLPVVVTALVQPVLLVLVKLTLVRAILGEDFPDPVQTLKRNSTTSPSAMT